MQTLLFSSIACIFQIFTLSAVAAENIVAPQVKIDWIAPKSFAANGETLVGIRFRPDPHWHVYWKNPGDSGAAPKFNISAENAEVSQILWPYPARLPVAHLTNLGYEGETAYLFSVKTNGSSPVKLRAGIEWLVCKEECLPGFGELTLTRNAKGGNVEIVESDRAALENFAKKIPSPGTNSPYKLEITKIENQILEVTLTSSSVLPLRMDLFPSALDYISPATPETTVGENKRIFVFKTSATALKPKTASFVLVASGTAYEFSDLSTSVPIPITQDFGSFLIAFVSAFIGGILLNLMPCVFPVISMKAFSLLKTTDSRSRVKDGVLYTAGVLVTFLALGGAFIALRSLGSAVGWGFQLQSPLVVFALIILFWLMALNFIGAFEFGTSVMNAAGQARWNSSFGTGVLAVFIAAPCTGPFMGTALGATATLPWPQALLVFFSLGFGLAVPYLALTLSPAFARALPRPGAWMETLKQFFAFLLFATVLWLLWVLGHQIGTSGWLWSSVALLGVSFAIWLGGKGGTPSRSSAWIFAIIVLLVSARVIHSIPENGAAMQSQTDWKPYSDSVLAENRKAGHPVFVDFTAAWCITCQVNKHTVLETAAAAAIFEKAGIVRLRADWTRQDPLITAALSRLNRNSVPVYAFYAAGGDEPKLLPQILTLGMIEEIAPSKDTQQENNK